MNGEKPLPGYLHDASKSWVHDELHDFDSCPFCGHWPYVSKIGNEAMLAKMKNVRGPFVGIQIKCSGCYITKRIGVFSTSFERGMVWAVEHWNKRKL